MKKLVTNFKVLMLAVLTVSAVSCTDDDDNGGVLDNNNSAYDLTVDNADFTILNAALLRTGLDATLDQAGGTYTVFAPTDTAFQTFLSANGFASIDDVPVLVLRNTLRNHVLSSVARSTDLTDGYVKTIATNDDGDTLDLYVDLTAGVVLNGVAEVTMADVTVDNGVVHVVD
ncbi:fasciclin domain-containing protein, partial [Nonlabens mediterrranea]|nr:fasciclin domain-containing protein [Nonlabens mediterrranea]